MKNYYLTLLFTVFCLNNSVLANTNKDDIIGIWLNANGKGQVQIYKEGDKYFGKLYWLKEPNGPKGNPKMDINNPNPALKNKPLLGTMLLRGFVFDDGEWKGGRIYDPENGKDYKCYIKLKDSKTLAMRGYIGISLLGRTEVWTRVK